MINIPIVDDRLDMRIAGEWTKRQGYSFNEITDQRIDGRDLWSGRVTLGFKPIEKSANHISSGSISPKTTTACAPPSSFARPHQPPTSIDGVPVPPGSLSRHGGAFDLGADYLSQGCEPTSLYSPDAFEVPNGFSLPYAVALGDAGAANR